MLKYKICRLAEPILFRFGDTLYDSHAYGAFRASLPEAILGRQLQQRLAFERILHLYSAVVPPVQEAVAFPEHRGVEVRVELFRIVSREQPVEQAAVGSGQLRTDFRQYPVRVRVRAVRGLEQRQAGDYVFVVVHSL